MSVSLARMQEDKTKYRLRLLPGLSYISVAFYARGPAPPLFQTKKKKKKKTLSIGLSRVSLLYAGIEPPTPGVTRICLTHVVIADAGAKKFWLLTSW
jgi:hypothetical protein